MQIPAQNDIAQRERARGLKIAAVLPVHYPRALLHAHGYHAIELWGPSGQDPTAGAAHFQAYTCAIVRHAASFLLANRAMETVDAVLVPHACDSLQGLGSVFTDFLNIGKPILTLYPPRGTRDSDLRYLIDELKRLGATLAAAGGVRPSEKTLHAAIDLEEEADAEFAALALHRDRIALDDRTYFRLLRSREYLSAAEFTALAKEAPRGSSPGNGVPLMIGGMVPEPMALFDRLGELGAHIVADDLACCSRRIYPPIKADDPYERMARALMGSPPDPTRGTPIAERTAYLIDRMKKSGARGMIVYDVKFCEPELFDIPLLRQHLKAAELPVLHLEHELADDVSHQTLNRIEAFVEMLR